MAFKKKKKKPHQKQEKQLDFSGICNDHDE
jgi:hypothetical protein